MSDGEQRRPESDGAQDRDGGNVGGGADDVGGSPRPDAVIPALDEGQLAALRAVGREWDEASAGPQVWREALPVDPGVGAYAGEGEFRPARFTRVVSAAARDGQLRPIETTSASETPATRLGRTDRALRRVVEGLPLDVSALAAERMRKLVALPVLSADALSSVAYGPQAMLAVLVLAGLPGLSYSLPVGGAIVLLMLAVGVSYRQTIRAFPQGGGSYIVATEELGRVPGLTAAAGLLIDYIMTVAVSIASGVAAITSAFPSLQPATVWMGVAVIVVLLAGNLRGVRQAGAAFAVPTYAFIVAIGSLVIAGLVHSAARGFRPVPDPSPGRRGEPQCLAGAPRVCLRFYRHDWHRGHLQRRAVLPAGRVAQRPDHADLDGRAADRDVRRRAGDQQARRRSAGGKPDDAVSARPPQLRQRADVRLSSRPPPRPCC